MKKQKAVVAAALWLATGIAGAAETAAPVCLIAGWENPPSVCAAHTKSIAATCFICHGPNGKSSAAIPGLAGQDKAYLIAAMKEYREGKRESTVMKKYALGYDDSEYESLAEFFAAIK
ncbi:MAG: cytochrome C [Hydrogenophilales bacterium CG17_big_fil_post_rev_8_21_14_2_50_63_12]|nr:MAG: cytochrome C [Hydrogenophilales bacterium CG17_big_fil_post_rev_8_21_14_2_50_63_12]PIX97481.1 MAG: cytochrome C [Hydrogenophilales bacterium CG_4_10_14_3_um_filter_63_21]PJB02914.1 MAG: cytochrome C [Hydrogenophilales bacterium CG_4_9_14_3_um_filter_63_34]